MPTYDGVVVDQFALTNDPRLTIDDSISVETIEALEAEFILGDFNQVIPEPPSITLDGLFQPDTTPTAQLLDRIYFYPTDPTTFEHFLEFGLITGDEVQQFSVWNAYISQGKLLTWSAVNEEGSSIDTVSPTFFNGLQYKTFNATVYELGPPVQDTDYIFVIAGKTFNLDILGERLQELDAIFNPNWATPPKVGLEFQTVLSRSNSFHEQRRPLFDNVLREMQASFLVEGEEFEQAHNVLKRAHEKLFFVPVFVEILKPTNATLQGASVLTFEESIEDYYHLRNLTSILIIQSKIDNTLNEYLSIDSFDIGANTITLDSPIVNEYITEQTILLPVMVALIKPDAKFQYVTDKVLQFTLNFRETRRG